MAAQTDVGHKGMSYTGEFGFSRITINPTVCGGKPCIRGLRFPVSRLLGLLAAGETPKTILRSYPYLEAEDIDAALNYAVYLTDAPVLELAKPHSWGAVS